MIPIVFGNRSFLLRSYEPWELELDEVLSKDIRIEKRLAYFHLFFIPSFSQGQFWAIRKDGELYEPSDELAVYLETIEPEPRKTPWYAYSFWCLLLLGALIYCVYEYVYSPYHNAQEDLEWHSKAFATIQKKDIYKLDTDDGDFEMTVLEVKKDSVLFDVLPLEQNVDNSSRRSNEWIGVDCPYPSLQVMLAKKDLEKCIGQSYYILDFHYRKYYICKFEGAKIKELKFLSSKPFRIEGVTTAFRSKVQSPYNVKYSNEEGRYYLDYD